MNAGKSMFEIFAEALDRIANPGHTKKYEVKLGEGLTRKRSKNAVKVYRMAGNGFSEFYLSHETANERAKHLYKNSGQPWYGRVNVFYKGGVK